MKKFIGRYLLFIYNKYILTLKKDLDLFKDKYKVIAKITLYLYCIYIWFMSIILFPIYVTEMLIKNRKSLI